MNQAALGGNLRAVDLRAMWEATPAETLAVATVTSTLALTMLVVALRQTEFGKAARRRQRLRQALVRAERARALAAQAAAHEAEALTSAEMARLAALRSRARRDAGTSADRADPAAPARAWTKVQRMWRTGYAGWIIAAMAGAFSMATHFGAFWLIIGGGWLGAALITLLSTAAMVAACLWIGYGLAGSGPPS